VSSFVFFLIGMAFAYFFVFPVLLTSCVYAAVALWWAIEQFQREEVLFRDTEQFDLRLWIKHLLRDKEPVPTAIEAMLCFGLIMLLQFGAMQSLNNAISKSGASKDLVMIQMLLVQQVAVIAATPLIMGTILTSNFAQTFKAYLPSPKYLAAGLILPFALHPLSSELIHILPWPELPASVKSVFATMSTQDLPLWLVLLAFAGAPAICEEIAFRGFILSGFSRRGRFKMAVVASSLAFGLMHMIPQQVFNAALLGLVLGALAVRANSILPGMLFHVIYNSLTVLYSRMTIVDPNGVPGVLHWSTDGVSSFAISKALLWTDGGSVRYGWLAMIIAAVLAAPLLRWLAGPLRPAMNLPLSPLLPQ